MTINYDDWYSNLSVNDRVNLIKMFENIINNNADLINMPIEEIIFHIKRGKILDVKSFNDKTLKTYFSSINNNSEYFLAEKDWETDTTISCKLFEIPMLGRQTIKEMTVKVVFSR